MPQLCANLSLMYTELPFLERFDAAAHDGFRGVECLFPYTHASAEEITQKLQQNQLKMVLFNSSPGQWPEEKGLASLSARKTEFQDSIAAALSLAQTWGGSHVHVMAGLLDESVSAHTQWDTYHHNLQWAAQEAEKHQVVLTIEALNTRDVPAYLLTHQAQAHKICHTIDSAFLKVQMDLYHCQIMEGDLSHLLQRYIPTGDVGHVQIAGVPSRHEPDDGELNPHHLLSLLDDLGYTGWVGCEYYPKNETSAGLRWAKRYF
jgi:hydroxypyruvate isomerase